MNRGDVRAASGAPVCSPLARRDWIIAAALAAIVFVLCLGQITRGVPYWGDDGAAYMNEGIAIARGEFRQQVERNLEQHPTPLPDEASNSDGLVYVWGYPLLLAAVYRLVGFDAENYSNVACYKLPSLLCLSLLAGVLYLLLRRRFSRRVSAPASLVFCLTGDLISCVNSLYSDVCFLFTVALSLLLLELFLDGMSRTPPRIWIPRSRRASRWEERYGTAMRFGSTALRSA